MDFTKATDEQIKNIIEEDVGIPTPLLKEVYEEAMKRNLFHSKIIYTIIKKFGTKENTERTTGLTIDDLVWIAYERGYEIIGRYKLTVPFAALWHTTIVNELSVIITRANAQKRKGNVYSMEDTYEWKSVGGYNTEPIAINRIRIEKIMDKLTETEKEIVLKRYQGYTMREIGEMLGVTKNGIMKRIILFQNRLRRANV